MIRLRACELMEQMTGMPSYLADDEAAAAAYAQAQAEAEYVEPKPLSPLQEAIRKAQGKDLTGEEIEASIGFLNRVAAALSRKPQP